MIWLQNDEALVFRKKKLFFESKFLGILMKNLPIHSDDSQVHKL